MHLQLLIDATSVRRWHIELLDSLRRRPATRVSARLLGDDTRSGLAPADRLFAFERALHHLDRGLSAPMTRDALDTYSRCDDGEPDLVIDLVGDLPPARTTAWRVRFDGSVGIDAAIRSLVAGRFPVVTLDDLRTGQQVAGGRPGGERPGVVVACFEDVLAGCATLIHAALDGATPRTPTISRVPAPHASSLLRRGVQEAASALLHGAYRRLFRAPHWRVGWRFVIDDDVVDLRAHPQSGWHDIPDDGYHFYADPFPIVVGEETYLFVEDFDHRLGRGVISVLPFDNAGPVGRPVPVLTHDVHLSYPNVFEAEGQVWMIPETSGARRVELYRAHAFPHSWVRECVLLDGIEANDVTILQHAGRWWMAATVRRGGSHSDTLHLWHSDRLLGPWAPHAGNPVVVDIATARPAGRVVVRDGRLIRPVQDCTTGYGAALALMEIVRLDEGAFEQRPVARLTPGPLWAGRRFHTLNRAGRLECIDGSRLSPRLRLLPRHKGAAA